VTDEELGRLRAGCAHALTGHKPVSVKRALSDLAAATPDALEFDRYGRGGWLEEFEARVAGELGKEAAVFLPSGTLAQLIALRVWCDAAHARTIAFHPTSHLEIHESRAYAMLHDLRALPIGSAQRLMTPEDVRAIAEPLGAFLIELPQREIGGQLPAWERLLEICGSARASGARLHLDGARLWEAAPFYDRSHAEIAALFDSVYVSFYKGLGALAGAMLAGPAAFIEQARVWQHRHGGRLVTIAPLALSARYAFEGNLSKMPSYRERALEVATALKGLDGVDIVPDPPHTNMFHIFLRGAQEGLEERAHAFAREHGTFVFGRLAPTAQPLVAKWEFTVGDATLDLATESIVTAVRATVDGAVAR